MRGEVFKVGDKVLLKKQQLPSDPQNWVRGMDKYEGLETIVTVVDSYTKSSAGNTYYKVAIDNGDWHWSCIDMILVSSVKKSNVSGIASAIISGAHCKRCRDYSPYAEFSPDFICWRCRH